MILRSQDKDKQRRELQERIDFLTLQRADLTAVELSLRKTMQKIDAVALELGSPAAGRFELKRQEAETRLEEVRFNMARVDDIARVLDLSLGNLVEQELIEKLYEDKSVEAPKIELISEANAELMRYLANDPSYIYQLHSRQFERLIAKIFADFGYDVELTKATHDGGKDLIVRIDTAIGPIIAIVECKRYSPKRPVGIEVVRSLYGLQMTSNTNKSMIVTTSYFSRDARKFASSIANLMDLHEYASIVAWLNRYKK